MDPRGLGELIATQGPALVLYARQWSAAPEDVVQEAFLKLAEQRTPPRQPVAWLFRVVRNVAIDRLRAEKRRQKHETQAGKLHPGWFVPGDEGDDSVAVTRALERLPDEQREIIVMHLWGGLSFTDIAGVVGSTSSTVHRWYAEGIAAIARKVGRVMSENELSDFERSLADLTPKANLDRDRLLFQAGVRAAGRKPRFAAAAMMLALGLAVGGASGWTLHQPGSATVAVAPKTEPPQETPTPLESFSYGALQQRYLRGDFSSAIAFQQADSQKPSGPSTLGEQRGKLLQSDAIP